MIVSDNVSAFTSKEFADFVKQNGITHVKASPCHPSTNRLAKHAVQTFKANMKKFTEGSLENKLSQFLFYYYLTPQTTAGVELLLGSHIKSCLDLHTATNSETQGHTKSLTT